METPPDFADDLLRGASAIAEFMFGSRARTETRMVYYLSTEVSGQNRPPFFKLMGRLCARKSTIRRWIAEKEMAACQGTIVRPEEPAAPADWPPRRGERGAR
jgi:hypothetical protein